MISYYIQKTILNTKSNSKNFLTDSEMLKVDLAKCEFEATNVSYLGYKLSPDGIHPGSNKLKAV
jgi:hypothetical protein